MYSSSCSSCQLATHTSTRPFRHHATAACWSNIVVHRLVPACLRVTEQPSTLAVNYVTRLHMSCRRMAALDVCEVVGNMHKSLRLLVKDVDGCLLTVHTHSRCKKRNGMQAMRSMRCCGLVHGIAEEILLTLQPHRAAA